WWTRRRRRSPSNGTTRSSRRPCSRATAPWCIRVSRPKAPPDGGRGDTDMLIVPPAGLVAPGAGDMVLAQLDIVAVASGGAVTAAGGAVDPFVFQFSIFVLAIFVGYYVVWSVTPALHTPLMSVTNAISSVIVVGALLAIGVGGFEAIGGAGAGWSRWLGFGALILASVNIFGGFLVTQ